MRFPRTRLKVSSMENHVYNGPLTPINRAALGAVLAPKTRKAKHTSELPIGDEEEWGPEPPECFVENREACPPWVRSIYGQTFGQVTVRGAVYYQDDNRAVVTCSCGRWGPMHREELRAFDPMCPHCTKQKEADQATVHALPRGWYRNRPIIMESGATIFMRGQRVGMFTCEGVTQAANSQRTYFVYRCDCGIYQASRERRKASDGLCPLCQQWVENKILGLHRPFPSWWPLQGGVLKELDRTVEVLKNEMDKSK